MENAKTILDKVSVFFSELVNPPMQNESKIIATPNTGVKMISAKLKDGTEVEVTKLGIGGIVTIKGSPAPIGEHTLEDGTKIVVGDNGVIMEIEMPQAPVVEDMTAKFAAFQNVTNEKFASYENKFASYENKFAEYEIKLTQANKVIQGLMDISKLLVEAPTAKADEVVKSSNNFNKELDAKKELEKFSKSICS